ncbi:Na+/H+ antiporter subunit E [Pseudactinotalea sp. Z1739]|uniref:Na+/H+ antiporter subunit E n=1 Tax=Pseudactinotalea sp. Z1739 TaxID=3413028 RepID=UPI003C7AF5FF
MMGNRVPPFRWWHRAASLVRRMAVFALLWWALTEGDMTTWAYGAVVVPIAVATSLALAPYRGPRPGAGRLRRTWALVRLTGWFLRRSLHGGLDVARRSLTPRPDLDPGYVRYPMRLPPGAGRVAVANLMNLMPGSLSVHLGSEELVVHVLDVDLPVPATVADLEERIALVAALPLAPPDRR